MLHDAGIIHGDLSGNNVGVGVGVMEAALTASGRPSESR